MRVTGILFFAITTICAGANHDPLDVRPMQISELAPGVHLHVSYRQVEPWGWVGSNGLVVIEDREAYLVDTPWSSSDTKQLVQWVESHGATIKGSLSTHSHEDRTAGIGYLNQHGIATYASELTNQFLTRDGKPTAQVAFAGPVFDWIPDKITVFHPGGGHTRDNVVVWLPESNILAGGCLVRSLESRDLGYTGDATIDTWAQSVRKVRATFPMAKRVVPGHGKVGDLRLLDHTASLAESAHRGAAQGTK